VYAENKKVGYFIDTQTGYLQYNPLDSVNASFFDTSAAFGGGGGGGGATGADADIVLVRNSTQAKVAAAAAEAREPSGPWWESSTILKRRSWTR